MPRYSDRVLQLIHRVEENEELTRTGGNEELTTAAGNELLMGVEVEHAKPTSLSTRSISHAKRTTTVERLDRYEVQASCAQVVK
jgi:hypothetical protein